jgi:predicted RecB family nuclease
MSVSPEFPPQLSKSKFVVGVQCLKRLYLQVHQPELAAEVGEQTEAILDQGKEVGLLAQRVFPGGVAMAANADHLGAALAETQRLIDSREAPAIFEATFRWRGVLARVDVLERIPGGSWRVIEVKSTTTVKDHHIYDVAIQRHVAAGCGLRVGSACLMHLNRQYVYDGQRYSFAKLFRIEDVTKEVNKTRHELPTLLKDQWDVLSRSSPPDIAPGIQCEDPVTCEFYNQCHEALPDEHISYLQRISRAKVDALLDRGVRLIPEIPEDFPLGTLARRAYDAVRVGATWFGEDLRAELRRLKYPLSFLDFETLSAAIPRHSGMRPYDHIPFQWSVHRQQHPHGPLEHFEFLAANGSDPRQQFVESLCRVLNGKGHIVVYNQAFESTRLNELAAWLPDCAGQIEPIRNRLWDLLPVVRAHVYHPRFRGSYSIKSVLPALIPSMTYDGMEIADGGQAGLAWDRLVRGGLDAAEGDRLREALRAYCAQDTRAMACLLGFLRRATDKADARSPMTQ